ncbi:polysaccharide biosynthesis tyrosine autokinase [Brachybacterium vulturis]|uniref:polysaccharide biosynthesis tyrosine autokinase n=1 Tax=Brachybacterium vulturis TaxID=2017484 RepID=UPI00373614E3
MELQHYLNILLERLGFAALAAVVVLGAVLGYTALQTPTYQATNRVFVQTAIGDSVADLNSAVSFASQRITSYAQLGTTPLVLDPVITEIGMDTTPAALAEQISVTVPPDTLILEITATSEDPTEAAAIANATAASLQTQVGELESTGESSAVALTIVSPATVPTSQTSPNVLRNVAVGILLALLAGVGMALVRDSLDNRIRRPEDIEKTFDRRVIATIPTSRDTASFPLISSTSPQSIQAEAYRDLRTNLQFIGLTTDDRSILVTSSMPGEGKSSSAINLAHVLAQSGSRVLLVDADLRRPALAKHLSLEGNAGLTTVLIGESSIADVAQPLDTEGLDVLTSGPIPPNPSELLGSQRMQTVLADALAAYDFVVVDSPPLFAVTDAAILSQIVGGTIIVARSDLVKKHQLGRALEKLEGVDARLLGVILNRYQRGTQHFYSAQETYSADPATTQSHLATTAPASAGPDAGAAPARRRAGEPAAGASPVTAPRLSAPRHALARHPEDVADRTRAGSGAESSGAGIEER